MKASCFHVLFPFSAPSSPVVFPPLQLEVAALERKLAGLREKGKQILMSIAAEEEKIAAVHEELSGEDGQLAEERGLVARQEAQLQKEVVSHCSCENWGGGGGHYTFIFVDTSPSPLSPPRPLLSPVSPPSRIV